MISKKQIKLIRSLHQKKFREKESLFLVEGIKLVGEALKNKSLIHSIYITPDCQEIKIPSGLECVEISPIELQQISTLKHPQGVLALCYSEALGAETHKRPTGLTLALDQVQDPGNLGTIIRIADWFGVEEIICSKDTVDLFNPKVVQATMGSIFRVPVKHLDLKERLLQEKSKSKKIYGTLLGGENIYNKKLEKPGVLVMGNESKGISREIQNLIDLAIKIPGLGDAESLNVAIATAVACSEFQKSLLN